MSIARQLVSFAIKAGSSDIHLEEGSAIAIRVNSDIRILDNVLSSKDMDQLLGELLRRRQTLLLSVRKVLKVLHSTLKVLQGSSPVGIAIFRPRTPRSLHGMRRRPVHPNGRGMHGLHGRHRPHWPHWPVAIFLSR